jgi:RNA polymerase sigma-70 factor (ECF subfamily)
VRRLQQADGAAYADLCGLFVATLHRYAASLLGGDEELAADVVVETMAEAARDIRRFDPRRASLSAWLHGIARRHVLEEQRRLRRSRSVPAAIQLPLMAAMDATDGGRLEEETAARLDAKRQMARLSAALSCSELEVLLLHWVSGFTVREIGRMMGRSGRAVESIIHRARAKARECLGNDE